MNIAGTEGEQATLSGVNALCAQPAPRRTRLKNNGEIDNHARGCAYRPVRLGARIPCPAMVAVDRRGRSCG
jgi:hypothetical protein